MHILRIPICATHYKNLLLKAHSTLFISSVTTLCRRSHPKLNPIHRLYSAVEILSHTLPVPKLQKRLLDIPKMAASNGSFFAGKLECFYQTFFAREIVFRHIIQGSKMCHRYGTVLQGPLVSNVKSPLLFLPSPLQSQHPVLYYFLNEYTLSKKPLN